MIRIIEIEVVTTTPNKIWAFVFDKMVYVLTDNRFNNDYGHEQELAKDQIISWKKEIDKNSHLEVNGYYMLPRDGGNKDNEEDDVLTAFSPTISSTRSFTSSLNNLSVSSIIVPANQRTKEIEEHSKRQFLDTIRDGLKINDHVHRLAKSAREEILMMFPITNTFYR